MLFTKRGNKTCPSFLQGYCECQVRAWVHSIYCEGADRGCRVGRQQNGYGFCPHRADGLVGWETTQMMLCDCRHYHRVFRYLFFYIFIHSMISYLLKHKILALCQALSSELDTGEGEISEP